MAEEDFWLPLVDEPIGELVARLQAEDPQIAALVDSPRRQLAFRTFAYVRAGILLGSLLVDHDVTNEGSRTSPRRRLPSPPSFPLSLWAPGSRTATETCAGDRHSSSE